jgi:hypothetical protein
MGCRLLLFFFIMAGRARFAHNTHAEDKMWARGTAWRVLRARCSHSLCVVPHVKCVSKARRALYVYESGAYYPPRDNNSCAHLLCIIIIIFYITRSKHTTGGTRCAHIPIRCKFIYIRNATHPMCCWREVRELRVQSRRSTAVLVI